jgi:hypothetical protein
LITIPKGSSITAETLPLRSRGLVLSLRSPGYIIATLEPRNDTGTSGGTVGDDSGAGTGNGTTGSSTQSGSSTTQSGPSSTQLSSSSDQSDSSAVPSAQSSFWALLNSNVSLFLDRSAEF